MKRNILNLIIFAVIVFVCLLADNFSDNPEANKRETKPNSVSELTIFKIK